MKIICVGRNYRLHAEELGNEIPKEPLLFIKPDSAVIKKGMDFYIPEFSNDIHYEVELILKIHKVGRYIAPEFAHTYFDEVGLGIDFTARDLQQKLKEKGHPWEKAKGFDGSAVIGDFIPKDSVPPLDGISFTLDKNGETVQQGNTKDMIFSIPTLISEISKYFLLKKGDLIFTGTPAGVGAVQPGDVLTGYMEGKQNFEVRVK